MQLIVATDDNRTLHVSHHLPVTLDTVDGGAWARLPPLDFVLPIGVDEAHWKLVERGVTLGEGRFDLRGATRGSMVRVTHVELWIDQDMIGDVLRRFPSLMADDPFVGL